MIGQKSELVLAGQEHTENKYRGSCGVNKPEESTKKRGEGKRALCSSRCPRQLEFLSPTGRRFATLPDATRTHTARTPVQPEPVCLAIEQLSEKSDLRRERERVGEKDARFLPRV